TAADIPRGAWRRAAAALAAGTSRTYARRSERCAGVLVRAVIASCRWRVPRMRRIAAAAAAGLLAAPLAAGPGAAPAAPPVELTLVLPNDGSGSMDADEYAMVKAGYRAAFSDPDVIAAIRDSSGAVAVSYVEFSGEHEFTLVRGWDVLTDAASAQAFGEAVAA